MFPNFLLLSCLFLTVDYSHGQILPPRNVSLWRSNDFDPKLTWQPPANSVGCRYKVTAKSSGPLTTSYNFLNVRDEQRKMEGGFLNLSIQSLCNGSESEPVVLSETNPDLVTGFQCYVHSPTQTNCSWSPTNVTADVRMFYRSMVQGARSTSLEIKECSSYIYTDAVKTGCSLPVTSNYSIDILFNATLNNQTVRNIFYRKLVYFVRPPPLNWTVEKSGNGFNINWNAPEMLVLEQWTFLINCTKCNIPTIIKTTGVTSHHLSRAPNCSYSMAIKAVNGNHSETPWSNEKYFDADADPYVLVYLAVIIPVVIATLTVLAVMCFQKNKANIFPKVPEPRDLLSDICDNNKTTLCNFHIPTMEEESCKVALVVDPQISMLDS